jgi:hypothetical protein
MTTSLTSASLQAADTVVMVQARDGLGTAAAVADVALATVFFLILVALVLLLFRLRGIHGTVRELSGRLEKRVDPVIDRGKEALANVEFITGALRTDVQRVSDSVKSLSARLQGASDRMEQRVEEFNALMEVVQTADRGGGAVHRLGCRDARRARGRPRPARRGSRRRVLPRRGCADGDARRGPRHGRRERRDRSPHGQGLSEPRDSACSPLF